MVASRHDELGDAVERSLKTAVLWLVEACAVLHTISRNYLILLNCPSGPSLRQVVVLNVVTLDTDLPSPWLTIAKSAPLSSRSCDVPLPLQPRYRTQWPDCGGRPMRCLCNSGYILPFLWRVEAFRDLEHLAQVTPMPLTMPSDILAVTHAYRLHPSGVSRTPVGLRLRSRSCSALEDRSAPLRCACVHAAHRPACRAFHADRSATTSQAFL